MSKIIELDEKIKELTEKIASEADNAELYRERAKIYRSKNKYAETIADYTKAIEIEPEDVKTYFWRAITYDLIKDKDNAIKDYATVINLDPDNIASLPPFHNDRFLINMIAKDRFKSIESDPENPELYHERAKFYYEKKCYEDAINDYTKAIELNPKYTEAYLNRGKCYYHKGKYNDALSNYNKAIELNPEYTEAYLNRGKCYDKQEKYNDALSDYNRAIKIKPEYAEAYLNRGKFYDKQKKYAETLDDYDKAIEHKPEYAEAYLNRGKLYDKQKKYAEALNDYDKAIELNSGYTDAYLNRGKCYYQQKKYAEALNDYNKAIALDPENAEAYFSRGEYYSQMKSYEKAIDDYTKIIEELDMSFDCEKISKTYCYRGFCYLESDDYIKSIDDCKDALGLDYLNDQARLCISFCLLRSESKKAQEIAHARIAERNRVIQDLSHSIKNLISTVIDPLENLKHETALKPQVIENALRGANLVREIVNAMNLSFKGTIDDFYYDAKNNTAKDSISLQWIMIESLKYSVGNMFDGKYFSNFMRKYFPKKENYLAAKSEWTTISQSNNPDTLFPFLKKYFFETDFLFNDAEKFVIGNEKGSSVKLLILFQEIILNAVKYSAFVNKENRFLRISVTNDANQISVSVENPFEPKIKTKTTGIGHVIIDNFAKLLNSEPIICKDENIYSLEIRFPTFW